MSPADSTPKFSGRELVAAGKLTDAMQMFREVHPWMNLFQLRLLLTVAQQPGASLREIVKATGEKQTTVSRALLDMTTYSRTKGTPELLDIAVDKDDLRIHRFTLNPDGLKLLRKFLGSIQH